MPTGIYIRDPKKQYTRTLEIRAKTRVAMTTPGAIERSRINGAIGGRRKTGPQSDEHRRNNSKAHAGRKLTSEHIEKIKAAATTPEAIERNRALHKGVPKSPESNEKRRKAATTSEALEKSRARTGDKSSGWKGGISFEPYPPVFTNERKRWVRERDGHMCQRCCMTEEANGRKLDVHHIDYNKQNCNENNLITLCRGCNSKVNFNREHWTKVFQEMIKEANYAS